MTLPQTMSGVLLTGHGGPECLEWRSDLPVPHPGPGDVLVRVQGSAVNNTDINARVGWYSKSGDPDADANWNGAPLGLPRIQGIDACGIVAAVGPGVPASRIGERVLVEPCLRESRGQALDPAWYLGADCDGAFAEYLVVAGRHAHRIDSPLGAAELASFPCSASTAENMLTRAGLRAGETVLITGAAGGVGSAAVQLAKARDATVIAVARPAQVESLRALGADTVLDRGLDLAGQVGANAVDVVVDLVGGPGWPVLLDLLRPGGRLANSGAVAGPEVPLDLRTLYLKDLSLLGCTQLAPGVFARLVELIEAGRIRPIISGRFPLREIAAAQAAFGAKPGIGKIVLQVAPD